MKIKALKSQGSWIFTLLFGLFMPLTNMLIGQQVITTKLGQTISVEKDGSYKTIQPEQIVKDEVVNPFEKPKPINELDAAEKLKLDELTDFIMKYDTRLSALIYTLNTDLSLKQSTLQFAQEQNNQSLIPHIIAEIDSLKNISEIAGRQYTALVKDYEKLSEIKTSDNEANIVAVINSLYKKVISDDIVANNSAGISKQEKIKLTADTRVPWEIKNPGDSISHSLLTYTPEKLKNYYKGRYLLEVFAQLFENRQVKFDFVFGSKDIKKGYGIIKKDDFMRIDFIKGQSISLKAVKDVEPRLEPYTGNTIYTAVYQVKNKDDYKKLTSSLLDAIGVMWSSGFEKYPVYNIDFFKEKKDVNINKVSGK